MITSIINVRIHPFIDDGNKQDKGCEYPWNPWDTWNKC